MLAEAPPRLSIVTAPTSKESTMARPSTSPPLSCKVPDCVHALHARGYCAAHYDECSAIVKELVRGGTSTNEARKQADEQMATKTCSATSLEPAVPAPIPATAPIEPSAAILAEVAEARRVLTVLLNLHGPVRLTLGELVTVAATRVQADAMRIDELEADLKALQANLLSPAPPPRLTREELLRRLEQLDRLDAARAEVKAAEAAVTQARDRVAELEAQLQG
jgi:polyhydroxyalkanoate synthesis regulator phasin